MLKFYCRSAKMSDWDGIDRTILRAFNSNGEISGLHRSWKKTNKPTFENIKVMLEKNTGDGSEKIVAVVLINEFYVHFGSKTFKTGGLGDVSTDPDYQGRGLGLKLQKYVAKYLSENDFDLGILYTGSYPFYAKVDWVQSMFMYSYRIPISGIRLMPISDIKLIHIEESQLEKISEMYEIFNQKYPLTRVRDFNWWCYQFKEKIGNINKLMGIYNGNECNDLIGYVWLKRNHENNVIIDSVIEYVLLKENFEVHLINAALTNAKEMGAHFLEIKLPDTFPLAKKAQTMGFKDHSGFYSGRMVRVQNLKKILPVILNLYNEYRFPSTSADTLKKNSGNKVILSIGTEQDLSVIINVSGANIKIIGIYDNNDLNNYKDFKKIQIPSIVFVALVFCNLSATEASEVYEDIWCLEDEKILDLLDVVFTPSKWILYDVDHF